jgi:hypothetical protein
VAYSLIRPKFHISNIGHDGTLSFRNFIMMLKISRITILSHNALHWPMAVIRSKSQKFKIGYNGILSIGNFILMIKKSYFTFSAARKLTKNQKMCYFFRGNTEFLIYLFFNRCVSNFALNCPLVCFFLQKIVEFDAF